MPAQEPANQEVLPIQAIADRHAEEWVLVKLLDLGGPKAETPAVALAHSPDRKLMSKELKRAWKREPNAHLWIMHGGCKFGDGDALRQSLARIAAEGEFISVNNW